LSSNRKQCGWCGAERRWRQRRGRWACLRNRWTNRVKAEAAGHLRDVRGEDLTAELMEIARLKAELSRVRMERDIL
jgi:hypothetical protein